MADEDVDTIDTDAGPSEDTSAVADVPGASDDSSLDTADSIGDTPETPKSDAPQERLYAGKYKTPDELERAYQEAQRLQGQQSDLVRLGRLAAEKGDAFQKWYRDQVSGAEPPPQAPAFSPPTSYTPALAALLTQYDLERRYQIAPEQSSLSHAQRQQAQAYVEYLSGKWSGWQNNPDSFVEEIVAPKMIAAMDQKVRELENRMWAAAFMQRHQDVFSMHEQEVIGEVNKGATPAQAVELVRLRQAVRQPTPDNGGEPEKGRDANAKRHAKSKGTRIENLTDEQLAEKYAHLPPLQRARAIAKAMGEEL